MVSLESEETLTSEGEKLTPKKVLFSAKNNQG